jgi:organic radical activating enzyme
MFKCGYLSHGLYVSFGLDGNVLPCCHISKTDRDYLTKHPTNDLLNGNLITTIRKTAIKGEVPDICTNCVKKEQLTGTSPRLETKYFDDNIVKETITEQDVRYLQIRLSNVCNFKCTICGPNYSHLIAKEHGYKTPLNVLEDSVLEELKQKLPKMTNLKQVIFGGGEPFYNANSLIELLEYIPKTATIAAHTNGSVFNKELLDNFNQFYNPLLSFSIDGSGRFFNYQRSNGNWNEVVNNIKKIKEKYPNIRLQCDSTVSCVTFPDLPNFIEETSKLFEKTRIHFIQSPEYYQINLVNTDILNSVKTKIVDKIIIKNIDDAINNPPANKHIEDFWNYTTYLSKNRTDIYDYIPEIKDIIRCVN